MPADDRMGSSLREAPSSFALTDRLVSYTAQDQHMHPSTSAYLGERGGASNTRVEIPGA